MRPYQRKGRRATKLSLITLGIVSLIVLPVPSALAQDTVEGVTNVVESVPEVFGHTLEVVSGVKEGAGKTPEPVSEVLDVVGGSDEPDPSPIIGNGDGEQVGRKRSDRREGAATPAGTPTVAIDRAVEGSTRVSPPRPGPSILPQGDPSILDRIGTAAGDAARQLRFPVALTLIVLAFVMFQNYLDRKDPKLALAPIATEVMRFE